MVKKTIKKAKAEDGETKAAEAPKAKEVAQPKAEAKPAPKAEAKAEAKPAKKEAVALTPQETSEKEQLTKQAIANILKGIAQPGAQTSGVAYIPGDWSSKYKGVLGAYKKFVMSLPDVFQVIERGSGQFVVVKKGDAPPPVGPRAGCNWRNNLLHAWKNYCVFTPEAEQSRGAFFKGLDEALAAETAGPAAAKPAAAAPAKPAAKAEAKPAASPKVTAAASPKLAAAASPKAAPAASPAGKAVKKDKLKKKNV